MDENGRNESIGADGKKIGHGYKRPRQGMKHFMILQALLRESDDNHFLTAETIVDYLKDKGVDTERKAIYRDIQEINIAMVMFKEDVDYDEAVKMLEEDEELKTIVNKKKHGFYVARRDISFEDARLLAECVYSSKFIPKGREGLLLDSIGSLLSDDQRDKIKHDVETIDRVRTNNKSMFSIIDTISEAIERNLKIKFKYMKYSTEGTKELIAKRNGSFYIVSPFKLLVNEGSYYLLSYDDKYKKMMTYRLDRMNNVSILEYCEREGKDEFYKVDLKSYTKRVFSMYAGTPTRVTIRFTNNMVNTVIDRFGSDVRMTKVDENHFSISEIVELSPPFYAWLFTFGKAAKILSPDSVIGEYNKKLSAVKEMYESSK